MVVLGAAVIDDVIGLVVLALVVAASSAGGSSPLFTIVPMAITLALSAVAIKLLGKPMANLLGGLHARGGGSAAVVALVLAVAWSFQALGGLAGITGAYLAGFALADSPIAPSVRDRLAHAGESFCVPVFFVAVGLAADLRTVGPVLPFALAVLAVAVVGKFVGSGIGARLGGLDGRSSTLVGTGMIARGEVALVAASLGLQSGAIVAGRLRGRRARRAGHHRDHADRACAVGPLGDSPAGPIAVGHLPRGTGRCGCGPRAGPCAGALRWRPGQMNEDMAATFRTGLIALAREEIDDAEPLLRQVVEADPDDAEALAYLATAWIAQGRIEEARDAMGRALILGPDRFGPNIKGGELALRLGDLPSGRVPFQAGAARSPPMARATLRLRESSWVRPAVRPVGRSTGRPIPALDNGRRSCVVRQVTGCASPWRMEDLSNEEPRATHPRPSRVRRRCGTRHPCALRTAPVGRLRGRQEHGGDPAGLTTSSGQNLVGIAPGTITSDDYNKAKTAEPFAVQAGRPGRPEPAGDQHRLDAGHRLPRHVHAGRLRAGRDRLHAGPRTPRTRWR